MKKNLLLLGITILVMLIISESALRILKIEHITKKSNQIVTDWVRVPEEVWTEYDPDLGWFHQKNKHAVLRHGKLLDLELTTNSDGFRGMKDYSKEKPVDKKRVLLLGDSFTFGWGVLNHETFAAKLESEDENLEVINLGVCAYGIDQILLSFRKFGKGYQPDYVIIGIYQEDFWRATRAFTDSGYAKPYFSVSKSGTLELHNVPAPKKFELRSNQFPNVVERQPLEKLLLHSTLYRILKKTFLRLGRDLNLIDPSLEDEWFLGRAILVELVKEIRATNAEPIILVVPPKDWIKNSKPTSIQKSLYRFAEREKMDVIDLTTPFSNAIADSNVTDYYIQDDWHWTAKGHNLVAQILKEHLSKKL